MPTEKQNITKEQGFAFAVDILNTTKYVDECISDYATNKHLIKFKKDIDTFLHTVEWTLRILCCICPICILLKENY